MTPLWSGSPSILNSIPRRVHDLDALLIAVMQANGLTSLASHDSDFDRVPSLTRYTPV